jgi:hypothetical protein
MAINYLNKLKRMFINRPYEVEGVRSGLKQDTALYSTSYPVTGSRRLRLPELPPGNIPGTHFC